MFLLVLQADEGGMTQNGLVRSSASVWVGLVVVFFTWAPWWLLHRTIAVRDLIQLPS